MTFKFIHTADLHLGSRLHTTGEADSFVEKEINESIEKSFKKICDTALREDIDFIIISGDLYDSEERSINAVSVFNEEAKKLNNDNIDIYVIAGNHDPYKGKKDILKVPENVHIFSSNQVEIKEIRNENNNLMARILGQSYRGNADSRKMYSFFNTTDNSLFNIALLHTQLDPNNNNYVPCSLNDLKSKDDINYWALGHIHKRKILNKKNPTIIYPGIPQGRDFGETGLGGAYLVEVDDFKKININFIPTSTIIWRDEKIKIEENDNKKNIEEIIDLIKEKSKKLKKDY